MVRDSIIDGDPIGRQKRDAISFAHWAKSRAFGLTGSGMKGVILGRSTTPGQDGGLQLAGKEGPACAVDCSHKINPDLTDVDNHC